MTNTTNNSQLVYDLTYLRRITVNIPRPAPQFDGLVESFQRAVLAIFEQRYGIEPSKVSFRFAPEFDCFAFATESRPDEVGKVLLFRCAFNQHRHLENSIWANLIGA